MRRGNCICGRRFEDVRDCWVREIDLVRGSFKKREGLMGGLGMLVTCVKRCSRKSSSVDVAGYVSYLNHVGNVERA